VSAGSRLAGYGISLALVALVVVLRWFVIPNWSLAHPFLLFYPAIIVAGWYGGFGPGVVAAVALTYLWLPPLYSLRIRDADDVTSLLLFVAIGFAISLLNEARVRAERRARDAEAAARRAKEQH
jgi:K+-sensing histidine kinase KdpD